MTPSEIQSKFDAINSQKMQAEQLRACIESGKRPIGDTELAESLNEYLESCGLPSDADLSKITRPQHQNLVFKLDSKIANLNRALPQIQAEKQQFQHQRTAFTQRLRGIIGRQNTLAKQHQKAVSEARKFCADNAYLFDQDTIIDNVSNGELYTVGKTNEDGILCLTQVTAEELPKY